MDYDDKPIGGRNVTPNNISGVADTPPSLVAYYTPLAMSLMGYMKQRMTFNDLGYMRETHRQEDGTIITIESNRNGLVPTDNILIDGRSTSKKKKGGDMIYGYILRDFTGFFVRLPNGEESMSAAIDNLDRLGEIGLHTNNPAFDYVGYPDFGGCKRIPTNAREVTPEGSISYTEYASAEFEHLVIGEFTTTYDYVTPPPPPPHTWPDIYDYWVDKPDIHDVSGPHYTDNFAPSAYAGAPWRRSDGQGLEVASFHTFVDGKITVKDASEFTAAQLNFEDIDNAPWDGFYMIPGSVKFGYSPTVFTVEDDYWGYEYTTTVWDYVILGPGIGEPEHKWTYTETETVYKSQAELTIPISVASGPHQLVMRKVPPGYTTPPVSCEATIFARSGIIKRRVNISPPDGLTDEFVGLTIMVGVEGNLADLIY